MREAIKRGKLRVWSSLGYSLLKREMPIGSVHDGPFVSDDAMKAAPARRVAKGTDCQLFLSNPSFTRNE